MASESPETTSVDEEIRRAVVDLMADGRARTIPEMQADLAEHPRLSGDDALDRIADVVEVAPTFATVDGEHVFDLDPVLDGRVFTHRLTDDERSTGVLALRPDIDLVTLTSTETVPVADVGDVPLVFATTSPDVSGEFTEDLDSGGGLDLGVETLDRLRDGQDTVTATRRGDAVVVTGVAGDAEGDPAHADALRRWFDELADEGAVGLVRLFLTWLLDDTDVFRVPTAPVSVLIASAGLEQRGDWVGRADEEWLAPPERHAEQIHARNAEVYGFDECCHAAFDDVTRAFAAGGEGVDRRRVATSLGHGEVAAAFLATELAEAGHHVPEVAEGLVTFATALLDSADVTVAPSALYVRATGYDCLGRVADAEQDIRTALRLDGAHRRSLIIAAGYLDDRGDARRALDNLRRAGLDEEHPQVHRLERIVEAEPAKVGRNEPCPCGSGKKYKACCIDRSILPTDVQAEWLYAKVLGFTLHPARRGVAEHLAIHAIEREGSDETPPARVEEDIRLAELAAFDGGVIDWFIDERGPLLPRGERDLIEGWTTQPLRVFDVAEIADDEITLVDHATGARVTAATFSFDEVVEGSTIVARLLAVDDRLFIGGPITEVPATEVDAAVALVEDDEASAHDWAEWLGHVEGAEEGGSEPFTRSEGHHHAH